MSSGPEKFKFFNEGDDLYAAMLAAIDAAKASILLETYIFADDEIGRAFAASMIEAANRGIDVRLHIDAAGSLFWHSRDLAHRLEAGGVQIRWFHRWDWHQPWRYNRRNHRKILVIDREVVYLGGFNIHRENSAAIFGDQRWHDIHISTSGSMASQSAQLFEAFWRQKHRVCITPQSDGDMLISNYGRNGRRAMRRLYQQGFRQARHTIMLVTPYFVPDHKTRQALMSAAERGVTVQLLLPRKSDVKITQWAAQASYERLLVAGVQIYEYLPRVLHAKMVLVDGQWAAVGTANIDYRSFFVNYELNLMTRDRALCQTLNQQFIHDLSQSERVCRHRWTRRPWLSRITESSAWLIRRWL